MSVCLPIDFGYGVFGFKFLYQGRQSIIQSVFGKIVFKEVGEAPPLRDARQAHDAVPLILSHPCLDFLPHLTDGTKRAVELREWVVVALETGATEVIPGVVVHHLDGGQIVVMVRKAATIKETGTGVGGHRAFCLNDMAYNVSDCLFNLA